MALVVDSARNAPLQPIHHTPAEPKQPAKAPRAEDLVAPLLPHDLPADQRQRAIDIVQAHLDRIAASGRQPSAEDVAPERIATLLQRECVALVARPEVIAAVDRQIVQGATAEQRHRAYEAAQRLVQETEQAGGTADARAIEDLALAGLRDTGTTLALDPRVADAVDAALPPNAPADQRGRAYRTMQAHVDALGGVGEGGIRPQDLAARTREVLQRDCIPLDQIPPEADFIPGRTFESTGPHVTADPDARTGPEQAAEDTRNARVISRAGVHDMSHVEFQRNLEAHAGDAAWLQDYFRALGSEKTGQLLFRLMRDDMPGGGRDDARRALDTLRDAGLLNERDLAATFRPDPSSRTPVPLKALLDADGLQRQIESRNATLARSETPPKNTDVYNAYDALLTVRHPPNADVIRDRAARYGIPPALLAGTIAAEMDFDHSWRAIPQDGLWRNTPLRIGQGPGIASVHRDTLEWAVRYLEQQPGMEKEAAAARAFLDADPGQKNAADFNNSVEAAAIVLAAYTHLRAGGRDGHITPTEMAVTWGAFRSGVIGHTPDAGGYTLEDFRGGRRTTSDADAMVGATGDEHTRIGGNAYQSEPYFEYFARTFA